MTPTRKYNNQNWLPSIFNDFFDNEWLTRANATAPAINVIESDKDYKVEVAAPGMTKEDFNIHISENNELVDLQWRKRMKQKRTTITTEDIYVVNFLTLSSNKL